MNRFICVLSSVLAATGLAVAQDQPPLQRDLMIISELFPGTYDNNEQVYFDNRLDLPAAERHERVASEVRRIPNDRFGQNAFFILDYWYEQDRWHPRIYSFHVDENENAIRMKMHAFIGFDRTPYLKAHDDLSVLEDLSPEDLTTLPVGCDLIWRPIVHGYHGKMDDKACVYEESGETVYADYQMMLDDRALWKADVIRRLSDDMQVNSEPEVLHKQLKARWFTCNMGFSGDGTSGNFSRLRVHDQGGEYFVPQPTADKPDRQIGIRLRNVDWAMNNVATGFTNDVFVMYVVERSGDDDRNITYTWGAPEETSVGLNLQWMITSCYIVPTSETRPYLRKPPAGPWQGTAP